MILSRCIKLFAGLPITTVQGETDLITSEYTNDEKIEMCIEVKGIQEKTCKPFIRNIPKFIKFVEEVSQLSLLNSGNMDNILNSKMKNEKNVKDNLVDLISKIGEKITIRRSHFVGSNELMNFSYTHSAIKKNIGKIGVLLSLESKKKRSELLEIGKQLAMHVAALSPLAIDKENSHG